jgi:hypothetical protein
MAETPYHLWREGGDAGASFVACAMFMPSQQALAQRLAVSLQSQGLQHALFQVPTVHRSLNAQGEGDLSLSKPRFIRFLLERFEKPVLYLDCDLVMRRAPRQIATLVKKGCDFAIYNWLTDSMNDAWRPEPGTPLWKFHFRVDLASDSQLMAGGAVQLWRGTGPSQTLLADWEQSLRNHPASEDEQCLDLAYNHGDRTGLKPHWLPKSYCRYAYWIYVQPVIDHPKFPAPVGGSFQQLGSERFDKARIRRVEKNEPLPRELVVDVVQKRLLRPLPDGTFQDAGALGQRLYLPHA